MTEPKLAHYRRLMAAYEALLHEWWRMEDPAGTRPPFPFVVHQIEGGCPLSRADAQGEFRPQFLVRPGDRTGGLRELRDFTDEAQALVIVDPFFFSGARGGAEQIADDFEYVVRIKQKKIKRVHIVRDDAKDDKGVRKAVRARATAHKVKITEAATTSVHDRVWIADGTRGVAVGTSLNGIGNRAAFILELPKADLRAILEFLRENKLVSTRNPGARIERAPRPSD